MSVRVETRRNRRTGKEWQVFLIDFSYIRPDGKKGRFKRTARAKSRRAAEAEERAIRKEIEGGTYIWKEDSTPLFSEYASEFIETYAIPNNEKTEVRSKKGHLSRYLLPHLGTRRLDEICFRDVERLKGHMLARELSRKTVNNTLGTLRKMLSHAQKLEYIQSVPLIVRLKLPKADFDFLTFDEAEQLLSTAAYNPEWHAMIFVALRTGLRYGELCELKWSDIDFRSGRIWVTRSFSEGVVKAPKNNLSREIPLSAETLQFLKKWRHLKGDFVFCTATGGRRFYQRAYAGLRLCCDKAGLRRISWHVLRHSFASQLIMRGARLKDLQELLGHSSIEMTMRYAHLSPEVKKDTVSLLDQATVSVVM